MQKRCVFLVGIYILVGRAGAFASEALPNLYGQPRTKSAAVTDRVWPSRAGDAAVCLWKDDKLAAVSVTVDDNCAPDVPWWLEMSGLYGFPVTWFLITGNVGQGFGGTWDVWAGVLAKGCDVQSHTQTHLHLGESGWKGIEWEYAESKRVIEENLKGHRVRFLAYPGGKNSGTNDHALAAKYYAGARGVTGLIPGPLGLDYLDVRCGSLSALNNPNASWADPARLLDPAAKAYRGWCVLLFHYMAHADKTQTTAGFQYLADHREDLWLSRFGDTSLYGQERDTATLAVTEHSPDRIVLMLTDRMDDAVFDYPLTIKVRLYAGWSAATARQADHPCAVRVVEQADARYALVDIVPDRGAVTLVPQNK